MSGRTGSEKLDALREATNLNEAHSQDQKHAGDNFYNVLGGQKHTIYAGAGIPMEYSLVHGNYTWQTLTLELLLVSRLHMP